MVEQPKSTLDMWTKVLFCIAILLMVVTLSVEIFVNGGRKAPPKKAAPLVQGPQAKIERVGEYMEEWTRKVGVYRVEYDGRTWLLFEGHGTWAQEMTPGKVEAEGP